MAQFANADELWSATTFTILLSILVHGVTATPIMHMLDARRERRAHRPRANDAKFAV